METAQWDGVYFEDLLAEAAGAPEDTKAQQALRGYMEEVVRSGDVLRMVTMTLQVTAAACQHPHVRGLPEALAMASGHDEYDHMHEDEDEPFRIKRAKKTTIWDLASIALGLAVDSQNR